jgi:hypothetical protein
MFGVIGGVRIPTDLLDLLETKHMLDQNSCWRMRQVQSKASVSEPTAWVPPAKIPEVRSSKVIVAAFDAPNPETLQVLAQSLPKGSTLTVVSEEKVMIPNGKFKGRWVKGHPESASSLLKAGLAEADSFLVAGVDGWTDTEADIQVCSLARFCCS